jgi:hypothetical protein
MERPDAGEAALINDAQFLDELEGFEHREHSPDPSLETHEYVDAFDALESGLPMQPVAGYASQPQHARGASDRYEPIADEYEAPEDEPLTVTAEKGISFLAAAIVLVGCLTVGAATAALVFHDRVAQITSTRTASR